MGSVIKAIKRGRVISLAAAVLLLVAAAQPAGARTAEQQKTLDQALISAIEAQNPGRVTALLDEGANVRSQGHCKLSPGNLAAAVIAAMYPDPATLSALIRGHRGLNTWDIDMALFVAVAHDRFANVQILLARGAEASYSFFGTSVLSIAASWPAAHDLKIATILLEHGANVDARNGNDYMTALMEAARTGNIAMVRLLVHHGADQALEDVYACKARDYALTAHHLKIAAMLSKRRKPDAG